MFHLYRKQKALKHIFFQTKYYTKLIKVDSRKRIITFSEQVLLNFSDVFISAILSQVTGLDNSSS